MAAHIMRNHSDYDINNCVSNNGHNRFRGLKLLKNSYGMDDVRIGYMFVGENGAVREIPRGSEMPNDWYNFVKQAGIR